MSRQTEFEKGVERKRIELENYIMNSIINIILNSDVELVLDILSKYSYLINYLNEDILTKIKDELFKYDISKYEILNILLNYNLTKDLTLYEYSILINFYKDIDLSKFNIIIKDKSYERDIDLLYNMVIIINNLNLLELDLYSINSSDKILPNKIYGKLTLPIDLNYIYELFGNTWDIHTLDLSQNKSLVIGYNVLKECKITNFILSDNISEIGGDFCKKSDITNQSRDLLNNLLNPGINNLFY